MHNRKKVGQLSWLQKHKHRIVSESLIVVLLISSVLITVQIRSSGNLSEPVLYLSHPTASIKPGGEVQVSLREKSSTEQVQAVQAMLIFDAAQMQFTGFTEDGPFSQVWASSSTEPGVIRLARALPTKQAGVSGENNVVILNFKVTRSSGNVPVRLNKSASLLISSRTRSNILSSTTDTVLHVADSAARRSSGR